MSRRVRPIASTDLSSASANRAQHMVNEVAPSVSEPADPHPVRSCRRTAAGTSARSNPSLRRFLQPQRAMRDRADLARQRDLAERDRVGRHRPLG